jgi:hypothetical protein
MRHRVAGYGLRHPSQITYPARFAVVSRRFLEARARGPVSETVAATLARRSFDDTDTLLVVIVARHFTDWYSTAPVRIGYAHGQVTLSPDTIDAPAFLDWLVSPAFPRPGTRVYSTLVSP